MESSARHLRVRNSGLRLAQSPAAQGTCFLHNGVKAPKAIAAKIARLATGPHMPPRVLDLFAGCGGLSLGFQAAGCEIVAAIEMDELAAQSHALNFCKGRTAVEIEHHAQPRDITEIEPEELVEDFQLGPPEQAIDIIVGGPPCQAYVRIGRAKLREMTGSFLGPGRPGQVADLTSRSIPWNR